MRAILRDYYEELGVKDKSKRKLIPDLAKPENCNRIEEDEGEGKELLLICSGYLEILKRYLGNETQHVKM